MLLKYVNLLPELIFLTCVKLDKRISLKHHITTNNFDVPGQADVKQLVHGSGRVASRVVSNADVGEAPRAARHHIAHKGQHPVSTWANADKYVQYELTHIN